MKSISTRMHESGAVSLFVVIFATLLITVVTVSFLRLMINDQNQASNNDLSQSAYDSAQAGTEDAKRTLLRYQAYCNENGAALCSDLADKIGAADCNSALRIGDVITSNEIKPGSADTATQTGEVPIQQTSSSSDNDLDQAYTCVKIKMLTDDYLGSVAANESKLVPLVGKTTDSSASTEFDTVTVEWFSTEDIGKTSSGSYDISLAGGTKPGPLLATSSWPANRPSLLRVQLMQFGSNFTVSDFDTTNASGQSNANTLFLYPTSSATVNSQSFTARDLRKTSPTADSPVDGRDDTPLLVNCKSTLSAGGYACSTKLVLPTPIGGGDRTAFLRVTPLYTASHFRVTLSNGSTPYKFNGVQPEIDSTGRANDLFRRLASRIDLIDTSFPYPEAAVDVSGSFCKDFSVTDTTYYAGATCTP